MLLNPSVRLSNHFSFIIFHIQPHLVNISQEIVTRSINDYYLTKKKINNKTLQTILNIFLQYLYFHCHNSMCNVIETRYALFLLQLHDARNELFNRTSNCLVNHINYMVCKLIYPPYICTYAIQWCIFPSYLHVLIWLAS